MRLDTNSTIGGQPAKRIRELLRRMGDARWNEVEIADFLHVDAAQAQALITEMTARGLLEKSGAAGRDLESYECGPQGLRFASARLLKPITRQKADDIIAGLLQRVEWVNAQPELLERVSEVRVFGSYLEERNDLGDVDVAVRTERRERSGKDWVRASMRRADARSRITLITCPMDTPRLCVC